MFFFFSRMIKCDWLWEKRLCVENSRLPSTNTICLHSNQLGLGKVRPLYSNIMEKFWYVLLSMCCHGKVQRCKCASFSQSRSQMFRLIMSSYLPNWTNFYSFRRRMSEYFSWIWTLVVQWRSCARYSIVCMVGKDVRSYCWFQVWSSTTTPWSYRLITKASAIHSMSGSHTDGTLNSGGIYPRKFMEIKPKHAAVKRWQHSSMELLPYSHFQLLMTDMYKQKVGW